MPRYPVNGHVEEHRRHCTALSDASLHFKAGFAVAYSACEVVVLGELEVVFFFPAKGERALAS